MPLVTKAAEDVIIPSICDTSPYIQSVAGVEARALALSRLFNLVVTSEDYLFTCDPVQGLFGKDTVYGSCN